MARIAIAGLYTLETNVAIPGFPLNYTPVNFAFHGIQQCHAGVGYNLAVALTRLDNTVRFATIVGEDEIGQHARHALVAEGIGPQFLVNLPGATSQSVILVAPDGTRQIHCDLKNLQETAYPSDILPEVLGEADAVIACNINFARPLLDQAHGQLIATDVHTLSQFDDAYNRDFMAASDILFLSHEALPMSPEACLSELHRRYGSEVIVIGLGAQGVIFSEKGAPAKALRSRPQRPVINTIGAGDALFASFIDQYLRTGDVRRSLINAQIYAGWKIGESGATKGLLTQSQLAALIDQEVINV